MPQPFMVVFKTCPPTPKFNLPPKRPSIPEDMVNIRGGGCFSKTNRKGLVKWESDHGLKLYTLNPKPGTGC